MEKKPTRLPSKVPGRIHLTTSNHKLDFEIDFIALAERKGVHDKQRYLVEILEGGKILATPM